MKRFLSVIFLVLCLVMIFGNITTGQAEGANSSYKQKIVYLLMDNSGSMWLNPEKNDLDKSKWNSAIYALESLASLLNDKDKLVVSSVVSYKNNSAKKVEFEYNELSTENLKELVNKCKGKTEPPEGSTPIAGVEALYAQLQNDYVNKQLSYDQEIWFIVVTDGQFNRKHNKDYLTDEDVYELLKEYTGKEIGGVFPQVLYLVIEPEEDPTKDTNKDKSIQEFIKANNETRIREYQSPQATDIVDTMDKISDRVSGRIRYNSERYTLEGTTIKLHVDFPMRDMILMVQSQEDYSNISVSALKEEDALMAGERNVDIVSPGGNLKAYVRQYIHSQEGYNIAEGDYTINLGRSPSTGDVITVLFQPAVDVHNEYYLVDSFGNETGPFSAGELIDSRRTYVGQKVHVHVKIKESGTGREYSLDQIGAEAAVRSGNTSLNEIRENVYEYIIQEGTNTITTEAVLTNHGEQTLREEVVFSVTRTQPPEEIQTADFSVNSDGYADTKTQLEMMKSGARVTFKVTGTLEKSLRDYYNDNTLTVKTSDNAFSTEPAADSQSPDQITFVLKPVDTKNAPDPGNVTIEVSFRNQPLTPGTVCIRESRLALHADGKAEIKAAELDLGMNGIQKEINLTENGNPINEVPVLTQSDIPGASFDKGLLTIPAGTKIPHGSYGIHAEDVYGLPVEGISLVVEKSRPTLTVNGGNQISVSLLELKKLMNIKKSLQVSEGDRIIDVSALILDVSSIPGLTYENGELTITYSDDLQKGTFTAEHPGTIFGIPVEGDISVTYTDGIEAVGIASNPIVDETKMNCTVSQVELYENGAALVFPVTENGNAVDESVIRNWIDEGKLTLSTQPAGMESGSPAPVAGGVKIAFSSEQWIKPGEYSAGLTINGAESTGHITVKESKFSINEIPPVDYQTFRNGNAKIRIKEITDDAGKKLDPARYELEFVNDEAGKWNSEEMTFSLYGTGDIKEPIQADYKIKGEKKGTAVIRITDPFDGISEWNREGDNPEQKQADAVRTQWQFKYVNSEVELYFPLKDGMTQAEAEILKNTVQIEASDSSLPYSLISKDGGYRLLISVPENMKYQDIPTGRLEYALVHDEKIYGRSTLEIQKSNITVNNETPAMKWTEFRDSGEMKLRLSIKDNQNLLSAKDSDLMIQLGEAGKLAPENSNEEYAAFAIGFPENLNQGQTIEVHTFAKGEEMNTLTLSFGAARYDIKVEPETQTVSQMELTLGTEIAVQLLEDGNPIDPADVHYDSLPAGMKEIGRENQGTKTVFRVGSDKATVSTEQYSIIFSCDRNGRRIEQKASIHVGSAAYTIEGPGQIPDVDPKDLVHENGKTITYRIKYDGQKDVPKEHIRELFKSLPETVQEDPAIRLKWNEAEDGVLNCTITTDKPLADFSDEKHYTIQCELYNGESRTTGFTVKKVFYGMENINGAQTIVHTQLQDKDRVYTNFLVYYMDEKGEKQGPVPTEELQKWINDPASEMFTTHLAYEPEDSCWPKASERARMNRERLIVRLETTENDGEIRAYVESPWDYEGLGGLEGYWHNAGNRWFLPVGNVKLTLDLNASEKITKAADFSVVRDEPLPEALYFWIPLYLVLSVLRALVKKKFPFRRLQVSGLNSTNGSYKYRSTEGKGFFCRKVFGFFLWPITLIPNTFIRLFSKDHHDLWTEKNIQVCTGITVKAIATDRLIWPLKRNKEVMIELGPIRYRKISVRNTRRGSRHNDFNVSLISSKFKAQPGSSDRGPKLIDPSDALLLEQNNRYGIIMKQNL